MSCLGERSGPASSAAALAAVALAPVALSLLLAVPGWISIDEGTYHWMVEAWADEGRLWIDNGYREMRSPELVAASVVPRGDRLWPMPPAPFALLAAPFYAAAGYRGLFHLNALAFGVLLASTFRLGVKLFDDRWVAWTAVGILALATFAADYALAAWPHMLAATFVVGSFTAAVEELQRSGRRKVPLWALAAGLLAGLGTGVRLDAFFVLAAIAAAFSIARPIRLRALAALAVGTLPGLALLAWSNQVKFDTWSPFTYGFSAGRGNAGVLAYLPLAAVALTGIAGLILLSRAEVRGRLRDHRWATLAAAAGAVGLVLVVPQLREPALRLGGGLWQLVVDLRVRDLSISEPALGRTPSGGMVYIGALKKSLAQSCPWLGALILPAVVALRGRGRRARELALLALPVAVYLGVYGWWAWHGGLSLNLRYLLPILPFLALGGAVAARRLLACAPRSGAIATAAATALAVAAFAAVDPLSAPLPGQELFVNQVPLALAAGLLLFALAAGLSTPASRLLTLAAACALGAALGWAAATTYLYDLPRARRHRAANLAVSERVAAAVPPGSLVFVPYPDPFFGLIEVPGVVLAVPGRDRFADFRPLTERFLATGRPVYAALPAEAWRWASEAGMLSGLAGRPVAGTPLVRLEREPGAGGA